MELCIPAAKRDRAIKVLEAASEDYERLPDLLEPDFYHPYKRGAARFEMRTVLPPFELQLIADNELGLEVSAPETIETGLTNATAHPELHDLCVNVNHATLNAIKWPTLAAFTRGWLMLGVLHAESEYVSLYLMQAERLIDANNVSNAWCEQEFGNMACCLEAKKLLQGKEGRRLGSTFD